MLRVFGDFTRVVWLCVCVCVVVCVCVRACQRADPRGGLFPMFLNPAHGSFIQSAYTLGARGDSLYEYLMKQFVQAGNKRGDRCVLASRFCDAVA